MMNRGWSVATAVFLGAVVPHGVAGERFLVEQFTVPVPCDSAGPITTNAQTDVFKLDSAVGTVWRLDTNEFVLIAAQDLASQKGATEAKMREIRQRLKNTIIPTVDYQDTPLSNVVASLQEAIRLHDPSLPAGSQKFLRLVYRCHDADSSPTVTFHARDISALEVLTIVCDVTGCEFRVPEENGSIEVVPREAPSAQVIRRSYPVNPEFRTRLTGVNLTNLFVSIGLKFWTGCSIAFLPEIDTIVLQHTYDGHDQFQFLLQDTGMAAVAVGRYRLVSRSGASTNSLFLLDTSAGLTWLYETRISSEGKRLERFVRLWDSRADE